MKVSSLAILIFASCIVAKNVVYLENLVSAKEQKRNAINVVHLEDLQDAAFEDSDGGVAKRTTTPDICARLGHAQRPIHPAPLLQSVLSQVVQLSIFARYVRDDDRVNEELAKPDTFTLFLAPSDQAISAFSSKVGLKPWEFPDPVVGDATDDTVTGRNIDSFVRAHMASGDPVITSPNTLSGVLLNQKLYVITKLDHGNTYTLEFDGKKVSVSSVYCAGNGLVFVIDSVLVSGK
ncbi:hypothetical protein METBISCDRAFT_27467 [Metschnikowia bicuspidata]|uniref:FAS1 domain-containing protein n=1 Tax=Metschnikowia bicuspidata TaxID=27322 RepID=A0A4P9ZE11_9ASCO|nr:hypothetical protein METBISCDRAFT_27467 [Metschnikowia bicuspidata]